MMKDYSKFIGKNVIYTSGTKEEQLVVWEITNILKDVNDNWFVVLEFGDNDNKVSRLIPIDVFYRDFKINKNGIIMEIDLYFNLMDHVNGLGRYPDMDIKEYIEENFYLISLPLLNYLDVPIIEMNELEFMGMQKVDYEDIRDFVKEENFMDKDKEYYLIQIRYQNLLVNLIQDIDNNFIYYITLTDMKINVLTIDSKNDLLYDEKNITKIEIKETLSKTLEFDTSAINASKEVIDEILLEYVEDLYNDEEIILDADDFVDSYIDIL